MPKHEIKVVECPFCRRYVGVRKTKGPGEELMARHFANVASRLPGDEPCEGSGLGAQLAAQILRARV